MNLKRSKQSGAVSLFIVIFAALLVITVTTAFVRIMIQDQNQATADDLSKSALDSANAGVEDAKRLLIKYNEQCQNGPSTSADCADWFALMQGNECRTLQESGVVGDTDEVRVGEDAALQQAYTCVKVTLNTKDYSGALAPNQSRLIPLRAEGMFDRVRIEWFSKTNLQGAQVAPQVDGSKAISLNTNPNLLKYADWPQNRPSLLRAQLIQFGPDFTVADFADRQGDATNASTLFLMPSSTTVGIPADGLRFLDEYSSGSFQQIQCNPTFSTVSAGSAFACRATIQLPLPIGASDASDRTAYLRLAVPYNASTDFRVSLYNDGNPDEVRFDGVQPAVDATGRANDLFRRVLSRVEVSDNGFPYVEGAIDITGDLCKTFSVTNNSDGYDAGACSE